MPFAGRSLRMFALTALAAAAVWPAPAAAQGRSRACFYEHAEFAGRRMCIAPGQRMPFVGEDLNDTFSSASVPSDMRVIMCEDANFGGRCLELDAPVRNFQALDRWNDRVSSIAAEPEGRGPGRAAPEPGVAPPRRTQVCFYEDEDFRGRAYCEPVGVSAPTLGEFNDKFSSMEAPPGVVVTACEHINFRGVCLRLEGAVPSFGQLWNDRISSFRSMPN